MGRLDQSHHTFIQALMARGPLSESQALTIFHDLCSEDRGEFSKFVALVNKELNFLQLEVRAGRNQYDGKLYYGLVNKLANEQAKLGTRYSHTQIAFFKAVVEAIVSDISLKGEISSIQALNLQPEIQNEQQQPGEAATQVAMNLSMAQKEKTLEELVHDHWLSYTPDGMVALGVRSFLELWNVFKNYDIPMCDVCNEAGIKAQACQNEECSVRMHDYCLKNRFHRAQTPRVCPKCGTDWEGYTGEDSQRHGENSQRGGETRSPDASQDHNLMLRPGLKRPRSSSHRAHRGNSQYAVSLSEE